jgi:integrase/recombinase XerD
MARHRMTRHRAVASDSAFTHITGPGRWCVRRRPSTVGYACLRRFRSSRTHSDERVLRAAIAAYLGRNRGQSRLHTGSDLKIHLVRPTTTWTRCAWPGPTSSSTYAGCRRSAATSPPRCPAGHQSWSASTEPSSSTRSCRTRRPTTCAGRWCRPSHPHSAQTPAVRSPDHHRTAVDQHQRLRADCHARPLRPADLRFLSASIGDLGEEHGHRVLKVRGKGDKIVLIPLPASGSSSD